MNVTAEGNWSTQQLAEFLSAIASCEPEEAAVQMAVERAAEALEAEVCIYECDGEVIDSVGFPGGKVDPEPINRLIDGGGSSLEVPGLGECDAMVVPVVGGVGGHLILARSANGFAAAERSLVRAMGRALSLCIGALRNLEAERERRALLSRLSRIQRSISHHAPLQDVLDAIAKGAGELLGERYAGVGLRDPRDPGKVFALSLLGYPPEARDAVVGQRATAVSEQAYEQGSVIVVDDFQSEPGMPPYFVEAGVQAMIAAPVHEARRAVGVVGVGTKTPGRKFTEAEQEAFSAFADHASLALTDARLSDQVERALHDPLTGLPNRAHLIEQLEKLVAQGPSPAVISLDLDGFRTVNDRIGHSAADEILTEVGNRLVAEAPTGALVARLEGDTFCLLSPPDTAADLAKRILAAVAQPFEISGGELRLSASIGIAESGSDPEGMLRDADLAMYRAGSEGGARIKTFEPGMHAELMTRMELQDDLARALREGEITAYFQPKVDLRSARVIGVEALVRWIHPERGVVSPADFLGLAEAGGHMRALTEQVIEFSTRAAGDWWHSGLGLQLSVNLAASMFSESDWALDEFIAQTLARTGLPGKSLQFEVTEDALMTDTEQAAATLKRLSDLGASISIDDFGTGHSSLGRLKTLPIDELKIDRSFIFDLSDDEEDRTIVRSTIHLAHQMGLQVVAEGVETEETWRQLRSMGCERAQGFLIAKPLPARDVPAWLATWNQRGRQLRSAGKGKRNSRPRPERAAKTPA